MSERARLRDPVWKRWGPYVSERAWATVREDYSEHGEAWEHLPHDHARSRAYRWSEDGLGGVCDDQQILCLAWAFWNGRDPILKERIFGLTGNEGNHGEDAKEYWFYLDSTPTHSWMRWRYLYPQGAFPYADLVEENRRRGRDQPEYELLDTGIFDDDRYWEITADYAKAAPDDLCLRLTVRNAGPDEATIDVLPTMWFRNTWSWGLDDRRPSITAKDGRLVAEHHTLGRMVLTGQGVGGSPPGGQGQPQILACDNETNAARLWGGDGPAYPKDGIADHVLHGALTVNPDGAGTKAALRWRLTVPGGGSAEIRLRLDRNGAEVGDAFSQTLALREQEADDFYATIAPANPDASTASWPGSAAPAGGPNPPTPAGSPDASAASWPDASTASWPGSAAPAAGPDASAASWPGSAAPAGGPSSPERAMVMRQALAGMLWGKQFFHYDVDRWLDGDPVGPPPPEARAYGRNADWRHLNNADVVSVCDKWEYPWFAAWDLAFHCVAYAHVDPQFAKEQLLLMCREWYMHPNGQLPAYEWAFGDVNPPVHAWAALRVFAIDGARDYHFLERILHKLLLNFTWWVNRKDADGQNVFEGGFLGMDNVGPIDRSAMLPVAGRLEQSDGTAWMGMFCLNLLEMALALAEHDEAYEDLATKFFEHFAYIATAIHDRGLWDEADGFYYDVLRFPNGDAAPMRVRSMVGLLPLCATMTLGQATLDRLPYFFGHFRWFVANKPQYAGRVVHAHKLGEHEGRLVSIVGPEGLRRILATMLDEAEFLSAHGLRSVAASHRERPFTIELGGTAASVDYVPGESATGLFGGNSNWRGPIWFPVNYLIIEALRRFSRFFGDDFRIEHPTGSGRQRTLAEVADDLAERLIGIFLDGADGRRPVFGGYEKFQTDPAWHHLIPFHEYFHGDTGAGLGASHQTGWTGLVADLLITKGQP